MDNSKGRRNKIFAGLAFVFTSVLALALVFSNIGFKPSSLFGTKADQQYQLILNSSNAVSTSGDHLQYTLGGGEVRFTYSNVTSSSGNHVRLNQNGTLVNKDQITSIESIQVHFSKSNENTKLTLKSSYDGATWGAAWDAEDNKIYYLDSNPYFIQLSAVNGAVDISTVTYKYSCSANPAANGQVVTEPDTWQRVNSNNDLSAGDQIIIVASYSSSWVSLQNEEISGYSYYLLGEEISLSSDETTATVDETYDVWTLSNGSTSGKWKIMNGSTYLYAPDNDHNNIGLTTSYSSSTCDWNFAFGTGSKVEISSNGCHINVKKYNDTYEFYGKSSSSYTRYIFKRIAGSSSIEYDQPLDTIGFYANDSNRNSYTTNSIFANDNGLVVKANYNDGSQQTLSLGNNGYSYVITNSLGVQIDPAQKFPEEGQYTLKVSYKKYIPQEIILNVAFDYVLTEIEVISSNTIFNTAQKLSDYTSGISVNLTYNRSDGNVEGLPYSSFNDYGLTLSLLDPSGVSASITNMFGVAGTWLIKVASNSDSSVFDSLEITVNSIPVTSISVSGSSATVEEESTLQLTVSVLPNNATNKTVTWSSNHDSIATVNTDGLVTGVSVGEAKITATANDGSSVYGYIDITVTAKPIQTEFDAELTSESNCTSVTVNGNDGIKVGTSKNAGSMTITVGAGATRLTFYAAAWASTNTTLSLTTASGTIGTNSFALTADANVSGNETIFTLNSAESTYFLETTLSGISSETDITLTAAKRFVVWGAKYYTVQEEPVYPTSITLTGESSIAIGETSQLTVNYTPAETNVKNVTFTSSKTNIATVDENGLVTGLAAGTSRITATAQTENGTTSSYLDVTVNTVAVTGVSLNKASAEIYVGDKETLTATIAPANATNQNVTWSVSGANPSGCISLSNGVVTGIKEGTASVVVTTADGSFTASCSFTVKKATVVAETFTITASEFNTTSYSANNGTHSVNGTNNTTLSFTTNQVMKNGSSIQFQANNGYLYSTTALTLNSITINDPDATLTVYGCTSSNSGATAISGSNNTYSLVGYSYFKIAKTTTGAAKCTSIVISVGETEPISPSAIQVTPSNVELSAGGSKTLGITYTPNNANQDKEVTWSKRSGSSNISVDSASGLVSVSNNASNGDTAVIRATLDLDNSIYSECTVTVVETPIADQTILIYMCGSDLESNGQTSSSSASGYASGDIKEILSVSNQPDDVNVVLETGGAKCWKSYNINAGYLERYHVSNKSLVKDAQITKASMGQSSTLQSFLTWGIQTYPADRISLILWNHGGAMRGVCYDENHSNNPLTNSEVKTAVSNTFSSLGRSTSDKLEWIGYDACLMQVQDIADFNSQYFNYMVASEESEAGDGWDYDTWIDDAYSKKATETILTAIVDGFIADTNKQYQQNNWGASDQTLSWLNLSYMSAYKSAWESMASSMSSLISSYTTNSFRTLMKTCKYFGSDDDCEGYSYFGIFDALDVLNKFSSTSAFSSASSQINAAKTAFNNLVKYSKKGSGAGNANGLCCFFPLKDSSGYTCNTSSVYTTSETNFTNWRSIVTTHGQ